MKKKRLIMTAALLSAFCMSAAGCSLYPGNKETQPANASQAETETKDETKQQPTGETEEETEKPTDAHPEDIEPFPHGEKETKAEPMKNGKRIVLMTDIHYLADSLTDKGEEFQYMVEHGDGKLTNYVWEITDAAFEQVEALSPDVIILSGDLTLNGEKKAIRSWLRSWNRWKKTGSRWWLFREITISITGMQLLLMEGQDRWQRQFLPMSLQRSTMILDTMRH